MEPTAFFIHSRIHKLCPHAVCVMHTHMPHATALSLVEGGRLEPVEQGALRFQESVVYDDEYQGLALDNAEGDRIARKLGNRGIMFMGSHGVVVAGPSVAHSYDSLYYLERACQAQVLARATGLPLRRLPQAVVDRTVEQFRADRTSAPLHFAALKRVLDREEPDYRE